MYIIEHIGDKARVVWIEDDLDEGIEITAEMDVSEAIEFIGYLEANKI